ncbi:hypothetical protein JKP88DRAFT_244972 [Tribonema minus]|uniref:Uncharacterized protein n=1 Tax=Tribonema minus TaxID=303371 RepID=A0A836CHQ7_9STRA|nr:hypothetical protein JKP88DRAFT_244972 [Tribonema minus]
MDLQQQAMQAIDRAAWTAYITNFLADLDGKAADDAAIVELAQGNAITNQLLTARMASGRGGELTQQESKLRLYMRQAQIVLLFLRQCHANNHMLSAAFIQHVDVVMKRVEFASLAISQLNHPCTLHRARAGGINRGQQPLQM